MFVDKFFDMLDKARSKFYRVGDKVMDSVPLLLMFPFIFSAFVATFGSAIGLGSWYLGIENNLPALIHAIVVYTVVAFGMGVFYASFPLYFIFKDKKAEKSVPINKVTIVLNPDGTTRVKK